MRAHLRRKAGGSPMEAVPITHPARVKVTHHGVAPKFRKTIPRSVGVDEHPGGEAQMGPPKGLAEGVHSADQHSNRPPSKRRRSSLDPAHLEARSGGFYDCGVICV